MNVFVVIMAGGVGERFWPESRISLPKQFLSILGTGTMIQETIRRMTPLIPLSKILIVSNKEQANLIYGQLPELSKDQILLEPVGKNTAPCIALAAAKVHKMDPDAVMVVLPADHVITQKDVFQRIIKEACEIADFEKCLITIGIRPNFPETGYGYIQYEREYRPGSKIPFFCVKQFIEKPTLENAQMYLADGKYLWNSGMFVWRCDVILKAFETYQPDIFKAAQKAKASLGGVCESEAIREMYNEVPKISIDYAIMEKSENILVASGDFGWDDVGSWASLERHIEKDSNGNACRGKHLKLDTQGTIVISKSGVVATIGIKDLIIVQTEDALLVMDKNRSQDVKKIIELLKKDEQYKKFL